MAALPPPNAKADVLLTPDPAKLFLAVFKSPTSVQLLPSQDSVWAVGVPFWSPPIDSEDV